MPVRGSAAAASRVVAATGAASAAAASTMPAPHVAIVQSEPVPVGNARALDFNLVSTCAGVSAGSADSISETTPATCGVAMLVPW